MKLGIEQIDKYLNVFSDKRVGLITNPTGIDSHFNSSIDILKEKVNLVSLFAPEHGVRGDLQAGVRFDTYIDKDTSCPVYSLYTKDKKPTKEMMDELDILAIDLQDVGSRFYTYIYTMAYAMISCKEHNKTFVVFDRPNPINGIDYEGNILDLKYRSFVGYYPILQRHGLTIGELAELFNKEYEIFCDLKVIPMEGWNRKSYYEDTFLPWVAPSPNIPVISSAVCYNATCIFEGTNLSEGRGTTKPFEYVGAPWINPYDYSKKLNNLNLPGVYFRPLYFTPTFSKNEKLLCGGVELYILDRKAFKAVKTGWAMLDVVRHMYPNDFKVNAPYVEGRPCMLEFNTGCDYITKDEFTLEKQFEIIEKETKEFGKIREKYLLY